MITTKRAPILIVLLLALGACAAGRAGEEAAEPAILEVENQSTFAMNIYVIQESGQRTRLGQVTGLTTSRFTIPPRLIFGATQLRFQADPVGSTRTPITDELTVAPGDTVILVLPAG